MKYGVIAEWDEISVVWYDTLSQAFNSAVTGDIVIEKLEELQ